MRTRATERLSETVPRRLLLLQRGVQYDGAEAGVAQGAGGAGLGLVEVHLSSPNQAVFIARQTSGADPPLVTVFALQSCSKAVSISYAKSWLHLTARQMILSKVILDGSQQSRK